MKACIIGFAAIVTLIGLGQANAATATGQTCLNLTGCVTTINGDNANMKECTDNPTVACDCEMKVEEAFPYSTCPQWTISSTSTCGAGWSKVATTMQGKACCGKAPSPCPLNSEVPTPSDEELTRAESADAADYGIEETFTDVGPNPLTGEVYFGFYGTTIRSSNNGRTNSIAARLDACLYYSDVDAQGALQSYSQCSTACSDSANKNEYCNNNNNEVCNDRCECYHSVGTCNNL